MEQEERAIRQQQQRDEMTDIELREDFEQRIVERWETRRRRADGPGGPWSSTRLSPCACRIALAWAAQSSAPISPRRPG